MLRTWLLLISIKFVVADRLPKIAYLTFLDLYMIISYVFMLALIGHTCVIGYLHGYFSNIQCENPSEICTFQPNGRLSGEIQYFLRNYVMELSEMYFMMAYLFVWLCVQLTVLYVYHQQPKAE